MIKPQPQSAAATLLFAAALGLLPAGATLAGSSFDPNQTVVQPAEQREFANINPMIKMATSWGDKAKGAHGTFGQFPASFTTPFHSHSGAYHGVVLKGEMTNPFEGEKVPPRMAPGSYWYVPASAVHATACVSQTPCEFYFHAEGPFDFHPVD